MSGQNSNGKCGYFDRNKNNDSRITQLFGALCCANDRCLRHGGYVGQVEGDGPALYECSIGEELLGEGSTLVKEVVEV